MNKIMKTFKASCGYNHGITEHEVIKETDKFITYIQKGFSGEWEVRELKETKAAEDEAKRYADRCMRLTKNADIANFWMMLGTVTSFVLLGLVVYGL